MIIKIICIVAVTIVLSGVAFLIKAYTHWAVGDVDSRDFIAPISILVIGAIVCFLLVLLSC